MADDYQLRKDVLRNLQYEGAPTFIRRVTPTGTRTHKAEWRCRCGKLFVSSINNVSRQHTVSCGCVADEARTVKYITHGHFIGDKPSPTYKSWQAMIARCTNPKHPAFHRYGGRGITICREWRESFEAFLADVGERPEGKTLDRKNLNEGYTAANCRWRTPKQQQHNRADTIMVELDGGSVPLAEAIERIGSLLPYKLVFNRVFRGGWDIRRACTAPVRKLKT